MSIVPLIYNDAQKQEIEDFKDAVLNAAADIDGKSVDSFRLRELRATDFDSITDDEYAWDWSTTDGEQTTFQFATIDKFAAVGIYGWCNGNVGNTVTLFRVVVGDTTALRLVGMQMTRNLSGSQTCLFLNKVIAKRGQEFKILPTTVGASATSQAMPMGFVAIPQSG